MSDQQANIPIASVPTGGKVSHSLIREFFSGTAVQLMAAIFSVAVPGVWAYMNVRGERDAAIMSAEASKQQADLVKQSSREMQAELDAQQERNRSMEKQLGAERSRGKEINRERDELTAQAAATQLELEALRQKASALVGELTKAREETGLKEKAQALADARLQELQDETKKVKIRAKLESADVRLLLSPFYTKSLSRLSPHVIRVENQPIRYFADQAPKSTKAIPVSLDTISSSGALADTELGQRQLLVLGQVANDDRPDWPTPVTEQDWDKVREAQKLLSEFGTYTVEFGLLAP